MEGFFTSAMASDRVSERIPSSWDVIILYTLLVGATREVDRKIVDGGSVVDGVWDGGSGKKQI